MLPRRMKTMMNKEGILEWIGCGASAVFTAIQTQEVFQIISLILTCVATLVTIAYTIYRWYKNATKDGKIDDKEIGELVDIINKGADDIKQVSGCQQPEESEKSEGEKK